jgi:serine/threonine-protein kinase
MATRSGAMLGTPYFMSPEQASGGSVDLRSDLWALGVVAFECLLGQLPFRGASVGRVVLAVCSEPLPVPSELGFVPVGFDGWFARACARDPAARFQSAKQAADAFDEAMSGISVGPASGAAPGGLSRNAPERADRNALEALPAAGVHRGVARSSLHRPVAALLAAIAVLIGASVMGARANWFGGSSAEGVADPAAAAAPARPAYTSAPSRPPSVAQAPAHERSPASPGAGNKRTEFGAAEAQQRAVESDPAPDRRRRVSKPPVDRGTHTTERAAPQSSTRRSLPNASESATAPASSAGVVGVDLGI